jgi:HEAT repeat protein
MQLPLVGLLLAFSLGRLPQSSTLTYYHQVAGCEDTRSEEFTIVQRGESAKVTCGDTTRAPVVGIVPIDAYEALWDSLQAWHFMRLDSLYCGEQHTRMRQTRRISVEHTMRGRTASKSVTLTGWSGLGEPLPRMAEAVAQMAIWATASVDQARAGKLATALGQWTPRMLRYIKETGHATEMSEAIIRLVDSTSTSRGPGWAGLAGRALGALADSATTVLIPALSHPNPQVRLFILGILTETLKDKAVDFARAVLEDSFPAIRYNAAVFLARRGDTNVLPVLYQSLRDSLCKQQYLSAQALLALGAPAGLDTMFAWAQRVPYHDVKNLTGLNAMTDERVSLVLLRLFSARVWGSNDRKWLLSSLGRRPSDSLLFDSVAAFLATDSGRDNLREFTVSALLRIRGSRDALPAMQIAFANWPGDGQIMSGLGALRDSAYFDTFVHYARNGSAWQRNHAGHALAYFNSNLGRELKLQILASESVNVYAIMAFIEQPDPRAFAGLVDLLQDKRSSTAMVCWTCDALGVLGNRRAAPLLRKMRAMDEYEICRGYIDRALESLSEGRKK